MRLRLGWLAGPALWWARREGLLWGTKGLAGVPLGRLLRLLRLLLAREDGLPEGVAPSEASGLRRCRGGKAAAAEDSLGRESALWWRYPIASHLRLRRPTVAAPPCPQRSRTRAATRQVSESVLN